MDTNGDKCEACGGPVDAECGCNDGGAWVMNKQKKERLEAVGWKVDTAAEFVGLPANTFKHGDCSACHDEEVLLVRSEQADEPLHYVCKECHFRGL